MEAFIVVARTLHFSACVSLTGIFAFECLVAGPIRRRSGAAVADRTGQRWLAWASLVLALVSGAAWLAGVAADMSGKPLGAAMNSGTLATVLTETRVGQDWLLRLALAVPLGACLVAWNRRHARGSAAVAWAAFGLGALVLVTLVWAGHGASDEGIDGDIHLTSDLLHLLAAGTWLGALVPFALLLAAARRAGDPAAVAFARAVTRGFSTLAVVSVSVLLASGIVNTWYLSGSVPALLGTLYGRLLLVKVAMFIAMLMVAAVNRLRLTPCLDDAANARQAIAQLRRNALIETAIGLGVLAVVGVLGILPPGLHTEPVWPLPFRLDPNALSTGGEILLLVFAAGFCACVVTIVVALASGRKWLLGAPLVGLILCIAFGVAPMRPAIEPAYPTTYYASPEPYDAAAVVAGAAVYKQNCAICHGADGRGDGPAAAGLSIKPADLTESHLFAHQVGDLYWWIGHGLGGVMPAFDGVLTPTQRWNVIHFIRARAARVLAANIGPEVSSAFAPAVPDFAFETDGAQSTIDRNLAAGPVLLVLFSAPTPLTRLQQLAAAQAQFAAVDLRVIAVGLGGAGENPPTKPPYVVGASSDVIAALALFHASDDGGETELMLDRNGNIRARWTTSDLVSPDTLATDARRVAQFAVAAPNHAGHGG